LFRVKLISHDYLHLMPGEANRVMRHPYMMLFYLGLAVLFTIANWTGTTAVVPIEQRIAIYLLAILIGAITVFLSFALIRKVSTAKAPMTISLSPIMFLAVVVGTSAVEALSRPLTQGTDSAPSQFMVLLVFYYLMTELLLLFTISYIGPRILSDLRGVPIRTLSESAPQSPTPEVATAHDGADRPAAPNKPPTVLSPAHLSIVPPAPAELQLLATGEKRFVVSSLLRLHAEGNYVKVTSLSESHLVSGPLGELVAALPDGLGCLVHRSDWIAGRAVAGSHRVGRDLYIDLIDHSSVKVALTRQDEVLLWLNGLSVPSEPSHLVARPPTDGSQVIAMRRKPPVLTRTHPAAPVRKTSHN
jgi:hypothetical protein